MRGEMSRERAHSLAFSHSLHPPPHVPGLQNLVLELCDSESSVGGGFGRVGPRRRGPSQACATGKSASSRSADCTRGTVMRKRHGRVCQEKNTHLAGASWNILQKSPFLEISPSASVLCLCYVFHSSASRIHCVIN
ncbi:uncharacterized [Tachysurus ichikawai]